MPTKTKKKVTKSASDNETMKIAITNLTDVVSKLEHTSSRLEQDVSRIKIRMGI